MLIGLAGGAALIAVVVVLLLALGGGTTTYQIVAPASAGGWQRDTAYGPPGLTKAELRSSQIQKVLHGKAVAAVNAVYTNPANGQQVIFIGATGQFGDPGQLLASMRAHPEAISKILSVTVTWSRADPGPRGGDAVCGEYVSSSALLPIRITVCAWQTTGSFGELVELPASGAAFNSGAPELSQSALAALMRRMRPDVEKVK